MSQDFEEQRRNFLVKALGTGLFASVAGSGIMTPAYGMGKIPEKLIPGKSVYDIKGNVFVDGQKADENTFIKADSLVETQSGSYVVFVIGTDAHVLRENSRVQFSGTGVLENGLRLVTGKLLSVFGARPHGQRHTMKTSTATIGIRGTGVYAESEPDSTYLCTCYGTVDLYADNDNYSAERIQSFHHDAPRYILAEGARGKLIEPAPVINHEDEELMVVESLVGRTPPFSSINGYSAPRKGY